MRKSGLKAHLKRSILTGLAALMPLALTAFVLVTCWNFVNKRIADPINEGLKNSLLDDSADRAALTGGGRRFLNRWFNWGEDELALTGQPLRKLLDARFPKYFGLAIALLISVAFLYCLGWFVASGHSEAGLSC